MGGRAQRPAKPKAPAEPRDPVRRPPRRTKFPAAAWVQRHVDHGGGTAEIPLRNLAPFGKRGLSNRAEVSGYLRAGVGKCAVKKKWASSPFTAFVRVAIVFFGGSRVSKEENARSA